MDPFKNITINDKDVLEKYLNTVSHMACDYSVANLILWAPVYGTQYCVINEMLLIKFTSGGKDSFAFPIGSGDLKKAMEWLEEYSREHHMEFAMNIVEPKMYEQLNHVLPDVFDIVYKRDNADYIYSREKLQNLSGKKYHGKKNHVNKFLKTYENWKYESINEENMQECIDMVNEWGIQNNSQEDEEKAGEIAALIQGLKHRRELSLMGGLIRLEDRVIAMTLGEQADAQTFIIHYEKAYADIDGAYPMINQQFILHELQEYTYINREEDMGLEGLRKAKESYHPEFMAEKGYLVRR